jgi:hypothetical protein
MGLIGLFHIVVYLRAHFTRTDFDRKGQELCIHKREFTSMDFYLWPESRVLFWSMFRVSFWAFFFKILQLMSQGKISLSILLFV